MALKFDKARLVSTEEGVRVQRYVRRRRPKSIVDFAGHRIRVGREGWPSKEGLSKMRRHFKRKHPKRFRQMIRKGVRTRARKRRQERIDEFAGRVMRPDPKLM